MASPQNYNGDPITNSRRAAVANKNRQSIYGRKPLDFSNVPSVGMVVKSPGYIDENGNWTIPVVTGNKAKRDTIVITSGGSYLPPIPNKPQVVYERPGKAKTLEMNRGTRNFTLYQQGGAMGQDQDLQQQITDLVQRAANGDQEAQQQIQQIMQAAQNGNQQAIQIANMVQQVVEAMKQQTRQQKFGGKLDYVHKLRTGARLDETVVYEKCGGKLKKKVVKKHNDGAELTVTISKKHTKPKSKTYFDCKGGKAIMKKSTRKAYFEA